MRRNCKALKHSGEPCRAAASKGDFCALHADPERAAELGRRSGLTRRTLTVEITPRELTPPRTAKDIKEILAQVIVDLYAAKIDQRIAWTIAYAANTLLKSIEFDERVSSKRVSGFEKEFEELLKKCTDEQVQFLHDHPFIRDPSKGQVAQDLETSESPAQGNGRGFVTCCVDETKDR